MPEYLATVASRAWGAWERRRRLTHIVFLLCDHFEPRHRIQDPEQPQRRMLAWRQGFSQLQQRCRDAFGHAPLHSFFYPPHHGEDHLPVLAQWVYDGLGEVELHYHHDGDTSDKLRGDLRATLERYNRWGLLLETGTAPRTSFGFIHGDWALDNSRHGRYCGVNDELTILQELGCWGDFTMPSGNDAQTRKINSIYYAVGDPLRPKSHDRGCDARVGVTDQKGLFLMQGPLAINWRAPGHPRIENASLTSANWGRVDRIRTWVKCQVQVKGRPDWLFVKLHCHGALEHDFDALFGERAFEMHRVLNETYNDGKRWRLHYVTARQAHNIACAAQHGFSSDPSACIDFGIAPPVCSRYVADVRHRLRECTDRRLQIDGLESSAAASVRTRVGPVTRLEGPISSMVIDAHAERIELQLSGPGEIVLDLAATGRVPRSTGARPLERRQGDGGSRLRYAADRQPVFEWGGVAPVPGMEADQ